MHQNSEEAFSGLVGEFIISATTSMNNSYSNLLKAQPAKNLLEKNQM